MERTVIGLAIIDKAALEDGILTVLQFKPFTEEPTQEDANTFLTELSDDKDFLQVVKETQATPICLPTTGLLCDMFDQMTKLTVDLHTLIAKKLPDAPTTHTTPKSSLILPGHDLQPNGDYPSDIPVGAQLIFNDIKNQMIQN